MLYRESEAQGKAYSFYNTCIAAFLIIANKEVINSTIYSPVIRIGESFTDLKAFISV